MTTVEVQNKVLELLAKINEGLLNLNEATDQINAMRDEVLTMTTTNRVLIGELQDNDVKIEDSVLSVQVGLSDSIQTNLAQTIHLNKLENDFHDTTDKVNQKIDNNVAAINQNIDDIELDIQGIHANIDSIEEDINKIEDSVLSVQVGLSDSIQTNLAQTIHIQSLESSTINSFNKVDNDIQDTRDYVDESVLDQRLLQAQVLSELIIASMVSTIRSASAPVNS